MAQDNNKMEVEFYQNKKFLKEKTFAINQENFPLSWMLNGEFAGVEKM